MIDATNQKTNNTQNEVTERLGGRVQDISYWKFELERAISDISAENDLMVQEIRRLEYAVQATDVPKNIANDCLGNLPEHFGCTGPFRHFQLCFFLPFRKCIG